MRMWKILLNVSKLPIFCFDIGIIDFVDLNRYVGLIVVDALH